MKSASVDYKEDLLRDLQNPDDCAEYLSLCLAESNETFLMGLKNVAEAQGGIRKLAARAEVNRENLYRMLSEAGNPRLDSLSAILGSIGVSIRFVPAIKSHQRQAQIISKDVKKRR